MKNISVGTEALDDPFINQGTAFSQDARIKRKLRGLLPPRVTTLEHQAKRALERIRQAEEPLQKYEILLAAPTQKRNPLLLPPRK